MHVLSCVAAVAATCCATAQHNVFASKVVAYDAKAHAGGGIFNPLHALGRPDGGSNVHSLGNGGYLTLGFDVAIVDGPGADLIVAENPFASAGAPWETFAEVCFVEVSSDGVHFARMPSRYSGPQAYPGAFAFVHSGWYAGLGGVHPVDVTASDPQDVVLAGGDAFDLADLAGHPLVAAGQLDLQRVTQVRLVDVVSGTDADARGTTIFDPSTGSADIDGVTVVQHEHNQSARGPVVDLAIPPDGDFALTIADPDGLGDLDPASFHTALWGIGVDPGTLFQVGTVTHVSATSFTLRLGGPLPAGIPLQMSVSVRDRAGHRSGASRTRG